jgi:hypothetical protein
MDAFQQVVNYLTDLEGRILVLLRHRDVVHAHICFRVLP